MNPPASRRSARTFLFVFAAAAIAAIDGCAGPPPPPTALANAQGTQALPPFQLPDGAIDRPLQIVTVKMPALSPNLVQTVSRASVEIRYTVKADGSVDGVTVLSSTNDEWAKIVTSAVSGWRYSIPTHNGVPTAVTGTQRFGFDFR